MSLTRIKMKTVSATPRGVWKAGSVLVVGQDCTVAEAKELLAGSYAEPHTAPTPEPAASAPAHGTPTAASNETDDPEDREHQKGTPSQKPTRRRR